MAVKKVFTEVVEFLEEKAKDGKATVASVMDEVIALCEAKRSRGGQTYIKDSKGKVVAINDYYFKRWMPLVGPDAVEFGIKASSSTGLNPACKEGASLWTKQNRQKDKELKGIMDEIKAGTLKVEDIEKRETEVKKKYDKIEKTALGFATKDEVVAYLGKVHKVKLV